MTSYTLIILSYFLLINDGKPADTCDAQAPCLNLKEMKAVHDNMEYRVCIEWDSKNRGCNKGDTISHSCPSSDEKDKISGWRRKDAMCKTVKCGTTAKFGIKDGAGCKKTKKMDGLSLGGKTKDIRCEYDGGYCGGGAKKDCTWTISVPQCPTEPTETPQCPNNQIWKECPSPCPPTCDQPIRPCLALCPPEGCGCPDDLPILEDGQCISLDECPPEACCDPLEEPGTNDNPFCIEGATCCSDGSWQCNKGDGSSTCSNNGVVCTPQCKGDMVWNECGSPCTKTCDNPNVPCIALCEPRCECPKDKPILADENSGKCIILDECPVCDGENPAGCNGNGPPCSDGYDCVVGGCTASICSCTESGWICTKDCGGGQCVPVPVCEGENPATPTCQVTGCPDGEICDTTVGCTPSSCGCTEGGWICTRDCLRGECVLDTGGELDCSNVPCLKPVCGDNEELYIPEGDCCEICRPKLPICPLIKCEDPCKSCGVMPEGTTCNVETIINPETGCKLCPQLVKDGCPSCCIPDGTYRPKDCAAYPVCGVDEVKVDDDCGCYCQSSLISVKAHSVGLNDIVNMDDLDGLSKSQFIMINVGVSVIACLLVIACCLTGYYVLTKCHRKQNKKYEIVSNEEDQDEKI